MLSGYNYKTSNEKNVTLDITKFPTWEKQAVTGRIKDWMKNSGSRLPVSCTVFVCDDNNIDESFIFTSKALRNAAGVAIHLPENIKPINRSFEWRVYLGENCSDDYDVPSSEIFQEPQGYEYVISVADSMEERSGAGISIENSWLAFLNYTGDRPVVVDLSQLRSKGTINSQGLTASGASSFKAIYSALYAYISNTSLTTLGSVYSTLNAVLRRGGVFKNGACLSSNTYVATVSGFKQVKELVGREFTALVNGKAHSSTAQGFFLSGTKPLYRLTTNKGYSVDATLDHKFIKAEKISRRSVSPIVYGDDWTELGDLRIGDKIKLAEHGTVSSLAWDGYGSRELGWLVGNWYGDGTINDNRAVFRFFGETGYAQAAQTINFLTNSGLFNKVNQTDLTQTPKITPFNANGKVGYNIASSSLLDVLVKLGINKKTDFSEKFILENTSSEFYKGFISGFFDADGTISCRKASNRSDLKAVQKNPAILYTLQKMLSRLGIVSCVKQDAYFTDKVAQFVDYLGKTHTINQTELFVLSIGSANVRNFESAVGFTDPVKKIKLTNFTSSNKFKAEYYVDTVTSIEYLGEEPVYDCTIPDVHEFDANGIRAHNCTLHYDYDYPYVSEFLNMTREQVSWAKRALNVDEHLITSHPEILADLIDKMQGGDVWLVKKLYDAKGERIYLQVCLEIAIKHKATCLLAHLNLGACTIEEIPQAMAEGVEFLCQLHAITGVGDSGIYRKPEEDRQVGYGLLGLANLLAIEGVTYAELVNSFALYLDNNFDLPEYSSKASFIVKALIEGYHKGSEIGMQYGMERIWTVAPTATCSYNHVDREGYTTAPEIAPPINRSIERDSATFGVKTYDYHPKTEIAAEVGWETFFRLNEYFQRLMDSTGLGHSISMNWWSDMIYADQKFIQDFLDSPIKSLYYSLPVKPNTQDKSSFAVPSGEIIDFSIFGFDEPKTCLIADPHCTSCAE